MDGEAVTWVCVVLPRWAVVAAIVRGRGGLEARSCAFRETLAQVLGGWWCSGSRAWSPWAVHSGPPGTGWLEGCCGPRHDPFQDGVR